MMFGALQIDTDHPMDGADCVETQSNAVLCSICLESVFSNENRSSAKLQCGHEFHLDCIGSAFNMKGEMQCPNCRKVEKGRWLFANGSARVPEWLYASGSTRMAPEYNGDERQHDWNSEEETYDFPELPFRVHWCPFGGVTRLHSLFEGGESPSVFYHDLQGDHAIFSEHTGGSSVAHSYITYFGQAPPPSFNSSDSVEVDGSENNHNWNGFSIPNDVLSLHDFSPLDLHYTRSRRSPQTSSHVNGSDQAATASASSRSTRGESDSTTWSGTFGQPYIIAQGSGGPRGVAGSFVAHHHSSSNGARRHERTQPPHATHQQQQQQHQQQQRQRSSTSPGMARRHNNGSRGMNPVQASPHSDHTSGFFVYPPPTSSSGHRNNAPETENRYPIHTHPLERDYISHFPASSFDRDSSGWGSHNQPSGGSDSDNRTGNIWQRHWS